MSVSSLSNFDLRMLSPENQKLFGCYGQVLQSVALAGDASGGSLTLELTEEAAKPNVLRCFKVRTLSITQAGAGGDADMTLQILGKGSSQEDRLSIPGVLKDDVGTYPGPWYPSGGPGLWSALQDIWFVPSPGFGSVPLFTIGVSYANPGAAVTVTLRVALLWDFYKPWR